MSELTQDRISLPHITHPRTTQPRIEKAARPQAPSTELKPVRMWDRRYAQWAFLVDLLALIIADVGVTAVIRTDLPFDQFIENAAYLVATPAITIAVTLVALAMYRAWDRRVLGDGADEFRRLGRGYVSAVAALAVGGFTIGISHGQAWVFGAVPVAGALSVLFRFTLRKIVRRGRRSGEYVRSVLVVGDRASVKGLLARSDAGALAGWSFDAVCLFREIPQRVLPETVGDLPVLGTDIDIADLVRQHGYQAVAILPSAAWTAAQTRKLAWKLEGTGADLLMAPALMEIAGPRLRVTPVAGVPLLQVSEPTFEGPARILKNIFDRSSATLGILAILPILLTIALAVRLSSRGPALYRQIRTGKDGQPFTMYKFRTMVVGADSLLAALTASNDGCGPLFKMRDDPRITGIGRFLRRYSLDELPQLFNVVLGTMSLIGPRPPLPTEVDKYEGAGVRRRLLVKPGLTGLWQVSGRSDLSWDESVQHDLFYVENWSLALDALILWKTARAVLGSSGAY